jgi:hypothetical protein
VTAFTPPRRPLAAVLHRHPALLAILLIVAASPVSLALPSVAVIVEDKKAPGLFGWGKTTPAILTAVESALEAGLASSGSVRVITRSRLDDILKEQGLAYRNVVNDRAALGRLIGADLLVVASLLENEQRTHRETVSAYGLRETQTTYSSAAALNVKMLDVESGTVLAQRAFTEEMPQSLSALQQVLLQASTWLRGTPAAALRVAPAKHAVKIEPKSSGREIRGLDVLVDGNFTANTPVTLQLETGVREISLRRAGVVVWSNRVRISGNLAIEPELSPSLSPPR